MVTPTCCAPSEAGSRRYSRPCPPYSFAYPDRRLHLSSHDNRAIIMTDREESDQPRKRIAVACGRCRKRKIRCSGDPGNGGPCSNCKNAGYEPCLFLRVSSTERHFKDSDYTYNLEAARPYAHQSPGTVSPLTSLPQYAHDITAGDALTSYRQSPYAYSNTSSSKSYYPTIPGWTSTYADDGTGSVDYSLNYSSYQIINQEPQSLLPGYSQYSARKSVYVDPETSPYSYGNLVHRPAVSSDSQGLSLSSMAASLPSASDRLHSSVNRTLTSSSSYRTDGIPAQYTNGKTSSANTIPDTAYSNLQPPFESPYSTTGTLASTIAHRPSGHADPTAYPPGATTAADQLYAQGDQRPPEDASGALGYIYGDNKLGGSRRDSQSSGGVSAGSLLSNGHVYVPDSHSAHPTPHPYVISSAPSSSQARGLVDGATASGGTGTGGGGGGRGRGSSNNNNSGSSHRPSDSQRRSAGSLRGG